MAGWDLIWFAKSSWHRFPLHPIFGKEYLTLTGMPQNIHSWWILVLATDWCLLLRLAESGFFLVKSSWFMVEHDKCVETSYFLAESQAFVANFPHTDEACALFRRNHRWNHRCELQAYWTSPDHLLWQHHAPIARQRVCVDAESLLSPSAVMGFWNLNQWIYIYIYFLLTTVGHVTSKFGNPNGHLYRIAQPFGQSNVPESFLGMSPCGKQPWQHASLRHVV